MICILVFIVLGILSPSEALNGFSNESIVTVALLILISAGLRNNFSIEPFLDRIFKKANTYKKFLGLMMAKVALLSSFVNNTPVVAMMTPYVFNWGRKNNISPSKLLIPLSFATISGGMITLIGTSTTLVLNGFLQKNNLPMLHAVDLLLIGGLVTFCCILFLLIFGHRLLPDNQGIVDRFNSNKREYLIEKRLSPNSPLIGKSVAEGGLRNLGGVYLVEIHRKDKMISPVKPSEIIHEEDILIFAGNTENIVDLTRSGVGVEFPKATRANEKLRVDVAEAVITHNSSLVGKTVKDAKFRNRYDAAVVAIHRNGEKLSGKIGNQTLKAGDSLLLYAGNDFNNRIDLFRDLILISKNQETLKTTVKDKTSLIIVATVSILLLALGYFSLFTSVLIIFSLMVVLKMVTLRNFKRDIDVNMMAILVFSLAIGQAIIKTKAGDIGAVWVLSLFESFGNIGILIGIMLITTLLTSFVTNVGAVSIAFPLAYAISERTDIAPAPLILAIAFAASAAFLTPVGYQTNLIVYGPGGYTFKDFFKIGLPITILYLIVVLIGILARYPMMLDMVT